MRKRFLGLCLMAISGSALAWLGYNVAVEELPEFAAYASDPEKLMKWSWLLVFAVFGGAFLALHKPKNKKAKRA